MSNELELDEVEISTGRRVGGSKKTCAGCCSKTKDLTHSVADMSKHAVTGATARVGGTWNEFKAFISKGNVFQMAVAFILGLQFNAVVKSLTDDIIMPPIGMAIGNNLVNLFLVIQPGRSYYNTSNVINGVVQPAVPQPPPYATLDEARADKAVTWNWGLFFQTCINFIIVALILFGLVTIWAKYMAMKKALYARLYGPQVEPHVVVLIDCPQCFGSCDNRAKICKFCHHDLVTPPQTENPADATLKL